MEIAAQLKHQFPKMLIRKYLRISTNLTWYLTQLSNCHAAVYNPVHSTDTAPNGEQINGLSVHIKPKKINNIFVHFIQLPQKKKEKLTRNDGPQTWQNGGLVQAVADADPPRGLVTQLRRFYDDYCAFRVQCALQLHGEALLGVFAVVDFLYHSHARRTQGPAKL